MLNLLDETNKALSNHGLTWNSVKFIRNGVGAISVADFVSAASNMVYDPDYGEVHIDPTLKIVGGSWWLERFNYDGHEGWVFLKKPQKPLLSAIDFKLDDVSAPCVVTDWERRIEQ